MPIKSVILDTIADIASNFVAIHSFIAGILVINDSGCSYNRLFHNCFSNEHLTISNDKKKSSYLSFFRRIYDTKRL